MLQSDEFDDSAASEKMRTKLLLSRAAILMGRLNYQLNNRGESSLYLKLAQKMARLAGDGPLLACALIEQARMYSRLSYNNPFPDSRRAMDLLDQAEAVIGTSEPPLVAWLRGRRALELAAKGKAVDSQRELDRVRLLPTSQGLDYGFSSSLWNDSALVSYQGVVSLQLGRNHDAATLLEKALNASRSPSSRAVNMMDLAVAYARLGETDRSCSLLGEALQLCVQKQHWARIHGIAGRRRRHLKGRTAWVRQLDEQLRQLT
jgi:tetratricopeptide (TPR) repeat protein